jgi:hypothetical protein
MRKTFWFPAGRISAALCVTALLATQASAGDVSKSTKVKSVHKAPVSKTLSSKAAHGRLDRYDQPGEAQQYYADRRSPDGRPVDPSMTFKAIEAVQSMPVHSTADETSNSVSDPSSTVPSGTDSSSSFTSVSGGLAGAWQHLGPGNVGGRTRSLVINPGDPNIMWAAGVGGGIWKSTDGGGTWTPKGDLLQNIAISTLIQDPRNANTLYAGTGEGYYNLDALRGAGIFKSIDGGETWNQLASTANSDFFYVQKMAITKGATQRIYAATRTGLFRSLDGGATFTKVFDVAANGLVRGCMDIVIQTDRTLAYVIAACGHPLAAGEPDSAIYRALDSSGVMTWQKVFTTTNMARTSLALAPSNQSIVYALASSQQAGNYNTAFLGVYRSVSSGSSGSWTTQVTNADSNKLNTVQLSNPVYAFLADCGYGSSNQFINQGWYDNQIAVDPKDPNIVWTAGIDLMRSDDAGKTWGLASYWWFTPGVDGDYAHADNHVFVFHPGYDGVSNRTLIVGSDGGIYKTLNARAAVGKTMNDVCGNTDPATDVNWTSLNNSYEVTQFYDGAPYPDGNTFFGGTQDNGTPRGTLGGGANGWQSILGGDGGYVAVDPTNTNTLYAENTALSFQRSDNGGVSFTTRTSGITEPAGNFNFIAPFTMDPSNPSRLWIAGARPWRTANRGTNWTQAASTFFGSRVGAIAVAPTNPDHVLMGTSNGGGAADGTIFRTLAGTTSTSATAWLSSQPRNGWVAWMAFDPTNENIAYAVYSTFNSGANIGHVFKSSNGGATWTNIDGSGATGIPDIPVTAIVVDPVNTQRIYIGTDIGVFVTIDGGLTWNRENTGFANVATESLKIVNVGGGVRYLYAFTHGRSAWRVQLP